MKNLSSLFLAVLVVLQFTACSKKDSGPSSPPRPDEGSLTQVDNLVRSFMSKNTVPGISLAITKNGKLVYAKGYGFTDKETAERVTTDTRFRISSISKSITAAAVMKLVEEGKIDLNDKIFGTGAILGNDFGTQPYKQYITDLTVKHCLSHHVGGWGNSSNDPTTVNNQMNANELISWILNNRPLDVPPGTAYNYSNVGFMILGRVIEKVTGKTYEAYVKESILAPAGITKMEIGGNTLAERKEKESRYYGVGSENPYGSNFSRRDANGGWIASASDLARLFVHIDGFPSVTDILQPGTIQTMTTPPFSFKNYALGMMVNGNKWYHGGAFAGSRSHWIRTGSGFCGVVFANTSVNDLDVLLESVINASVNWPDVDLFNN